MALVIDRRAHSSGATVVTLRGRITLGSDTRQLSETVDELEQGSFTHVVFDLSGVDYVDSAGLGLLTRCAVAARNTGSAFHLAGVSPKVRNLLHVTRLERIMRLFPNVDEACTAFGKPHR